MSGEGFLSRWSRRKREDVSREAPQSEAPQREALETGAAAAPRESAPELTGEEMSEEELAALPPIESIDATTDIGGYLRKGVPAALKNAALRRLWAATPAVRDYLDPARDYAWDWNVPGGVPGDGPLAPGFDAKALADKMFARRPTKVVDEGHAFPDGENADDAVSQTAGADDPPAEPEAMRGGDGPDRAPGRAGKDAQESAAGQGVAGEERAATPGGAGRDGAQTTENLSDFRPRPRRHGGATPV